MFKSYTPLRFDVQWSNGDTVWYTETAWEREIDAVIDLVKQVEVNPDLSHRIIRTERTILFTVEGVTE